MNAKVVKELIEAPGLARLGPERRSTGLAIREIDTRLTGLAAANAAVSDLVRSVVYLWHDHLHASHEIVQEIETADGSLVHAMMHRREPDYSNSKYWFRRVGRHPAFLKLAVNAEELLRRSGETELLSRLLPNNAWDPFAFVDAVEDAENGRSKAKAPLLEQIQKLEFEAVLENFTSRFGS